ncbi:aminotransferase class I/II-fold pyridoxal phosphate-dependent enzyme [Paracoccus albus]|uniref:aminotransferase class I/II-fold pyridoxal phosphate-dependent enzyme n=1 Tax=Paracoccus albus TaxID=3017784 RepID=UPI00336A2A14
MSFISERLSVVKPSASMAASQAAKALAATCVDVIDLGLGEPDFPTPAHIAEASHKAAMNGETLYTASAGTAALREAVAASFAAQRVGLCAGRNRHRKWRKAGHLQRVDGHPE